MGLEGCRADGTNRRNQVMKDATDDAISRAWRDYFGTRDTRSVRREVAQKLEGVTGHLAAGEVVWGVHRRRYDHCWLIWKSCVPDMGRAFLKAVQTTS